MTAWREAFNILCPGVVIDQFAGGIALSTYQFTLGWTNLFGPVPTRTPIINI
jgi:hypothetical protein